MNTPFARIRGATPRGVAPWTSGSPRLLAWLTPFFLATVAAQTPPPAQPAASPPPLPAPAAPIRFGIKGFDILGENPLGAGETARVLAPYLRSDASIELLQKATADLEAALRDKGFGLYRVALPPQDLGEKIKLEIVRFVIGKVSMEGQGDYSTANIRGSLPDLLENQTPNFKTLAIQTAIANENPGKNVTVALKESEEPDKIDAVIQVKPSKPWGLSVSASNTGAESSGKDRLTVAGSHNNLFDLDHQFTGAYTTAPSRASDVKQIGLSYRIPLYRHNAVLGLSHTRSDVLGSFGAFNSTGAGHTSGINYSLYLPPQGNYKSYLTVSLDDKFYKGTLLNGTPVTLDTRSRTATLGYTGKFESETSSWLYALEMVGNLRGGQGNSLFAYTNGLTNTDITTHRWNALRLNAQYSTVLESKWAVGGKFSTQSSKQTLISGEQFGLGGSTSVRGTAERAISGDSGLFLNLEASTPELTQGMKALVFMDVGRVSNNLPNGTTRPEHDHLASSGVGLRYAPNRNFSLNMDYARLHKGSVVPLAVSSSSPQKGNDKLHVNLTWSY